MRKSPGTLGLKKFGPGKFWVEKVWAQKIEKLRELKKKKKLMKLGKNWKSQGNKPEIQDEDALGKIEQQQDFVILELGGSFKVGVH